MQSGSKAASVSIIAVCQVAAMALWFSASAVIPALVADAHVVAVRRDAVGDDSGAHLIVHERLDHPLFERHPPNPRIGLD